MTDPTIPAMAELERPDNVSIHYELRGDGPLIALASYWSWSPGVFAGLLAELKRDHRVLTYDMRGCGQSTRRGPYDIESDSADFEALLEQVGGAAVLIAVSDSANRSARVAARRPELAGSLLCLGTAPFARSTLLGREGLIGSDSVVDAFIEMLSRDYRGALRTLLAATNEQMSEQELQERVRAQLDYCPQEAALGRVREWLAGDPEADARKLGPRLWIATSPAGVAGPWLPDPEEMAKVTEELVPEAHRLYLEGAISEPAHAADLIREIVSA
jgi:pimeloyl-ACP methyl ester carboxylesterase